MSNRFEQLAPTEDEVAETLLAQLAKAHASESRAADIVAEECLLNRYRYAPGLGWLEWDGRRWDDDPAATETVYHAVRVFIDGKERDYRARMIVASEKLTAILKALTESTGEKPEEGGGKADTAFVQAHATDDQAKAWNAAVKARDDAKRQGDMWLNLLSRAKIRSVTELCRASEGILTRTSELDAHPELLNCRNCVVNLRDGSVQPHDPNLLITKLAGGDYDPNARSAAWEKAKEAIHPDVIGWFQERVGQSFTGYRPADDSLVISAGGGENGKSAVMEALLRAAGTYGDVIDHKVLISVPGQHSTEKMDLRGLRLAYMDETPEEGHLDTQQLKTVVGTAKIKARHMRQNTVTFEATHTMWINTNFLPQVDTTDHGTWRRLFAQPWPYRYRKPWEQCTEPNDRQGDLTLKPTLETHPDVPAAILAWVVQGAIAHFRRTEPGRPPAPVEEATKTWRGISDVGFQFASDRLVAAPDHYISADEMFAEFSAFLDAGGKRAWSKQLVNQRLPESMRAAGIVVQRTPQDSTKVRVSDVQSHAPRPAPDGWGKAAVPVDITPGRVVRMWRGVRFRAEAEIGQPLAAAV